MKTNKYLTTKEFTKRVKELGFDVFISLTTIFIYNNNNLIATVLTCKAYQLYTNYSVWEILSEYLQKSLFKLLTAYASTPVDEREEEKKYYLKHRYLQSSFTNPNNILSYSVSDDEVALCNGINFPKYKTQFTQKEIDDIKEKYNTDLSDFERVEVEE